MLALIVACIPAVNEERTIAKVIIGAQSHVDKVIVCDDGSNDLTGLIAQKLGAMVVTHETNMGKGQAMRSLFLAAREVKADAMVTLDGDGQHDPRDIPTVLEALRRETADVVIGSRFLSGRGSMPGYRKVGNKILNSLTLSGVSDTQSGFRAYSRKAIEALLPGEMGMGVDSEILMEASRVGLKIIEVPISVAYGEGKTSTHNPFYHTLDVILSVFKVTSIRHPLLFYSTTGLGMILVAVYFIFRTVQLYLAAKAVDALNIAYGLLAFSLAMAGLLVFFTGIILFTISTLLRRAGNQ